MNGPQWRSRNAPRERAQRRRSLAKLYGALAGRRAPDGFRVLTQESIDTGREEHSYGEDAILLMPMRFGAGYHIDIPELQISPTGAIFGHAGMGGSFGYADPDANFGVGYVMNRMMLAGDMIDPRWAAMLAPYTTP
jgi:CubicO group peptidase (beta-lactamase class C family)